MPEPRHPIDRVAAYVHVVPTDDPQESDGTLVWSSTTCVVVELGCGEARGYGYTYSHAAVAALVETKLAEVVCGACATDPAAAWARMRHAVRNLGQRGVVSHAISAVDTALWDLKARLSGVSLVELWGRVRERVPIYGSGGFTSYDEAELRAQLRGWAAEGIPRVKMKVGREPACDVARVAAAREAIGPHVELFVDANGAYERKQALRMAQAFAELGVTWFEEPVSSDDLEGLRLLRDRGPAGLCIAAGEYGDHPGYFRRMLEAGAVDVLQADVTRCLGYTGLVQVAALCEAWHVPLSAHCAPALHAPLALCLTPLVHLERFHDHVRVEEQLWCGVSRLEDGALVPEPAAPGHGLVPRPGTVAREA